MTTNGLFGGTHRESPEDADGRLVSPITFANVEKEVGSLGTACL